MELIAEEKTDAELFEAKQDIGEGANTAASAGGGSGGAYQRGPIRQVKHEQQWNKYGTVHRGPKKAPAVSKPSKEEILKRRQWEEERRRFHEAQAKLKAAKKAEVEAKKRERENAKSEARKAAILERSRRWQERHAQFARERERGEDQYKKLKETHKKLLHEKLYEEYAKNSQKMEMTRKKVYSESLGRFRSLRPKEIIEGDALRKFKTEVGDINDASRRSKSTPCQRREQKGGKSARSRSNARPRAVVQCRAAGNSAAPQGAKAKESSSVQPEAPQQKGASSEDPVEEAELQSTLNKQKQEEERLEAAPEVVEDESSCQVAEQVAEQAGEEA